MEGETTERLMELCSQATREKDPTRFAMRIDEIIRLLSEARRSRLSRERQAGQFQGKD
jgi:hypothetical protein